MLRTLTCCIVEVQCDLPNNYDLIGVKKEQDEEFIPDSMQVDNDQLIQEDDKEDRKTLMDDNTSTVIPQTLIDDTPLSTLAVKPEAVSTEITTRDLQNNLEQKGKLPP